MMQRWPGGRGEHIPNSIYPGEWEQRAWGANTLTGNRDVRCIFARSETRIKIAIETEIHQKCPLPESNTEKTTLYPGKQKQNKTKETNKLVIYLEFQMRKEKSLL